MLGVIACGAASASDAASFVQRAFTGLSCSTDPHRGPSNWIDYSRGKSASEAFRDPKVAELAAAAKRGDTTRMLALLRAGVDPNAQGMNGLTLLDWSIRRDSRAGFRVLLTAGAKPTVPDSNGDNVMRQAVIADDTTFLLTLLAHHVDPNSPARSGGSPPLTEAMIAGCDRQFRMLLKAPGIDLNRADEVGDSPLIAAAQANDLERVLDLLKAGANPLAKNRIGSTFQGYLYLTPENVRSDESRRQLTVVRTWLTAHQIPIETPKS